MKNTGIRNAPPAGTRSWRGDIRDVQIISAARLSDILPGSYLLLEQSPGSSQYPHGGTCPSRADLFIIKENPLDVKRIFSVFNETFQKFLEVIPFIFQSFSPRHPPEGPLLPLCGNSPSVRGENTLTQAPWARSPVTDVTGGRGGRGGACSPSNVSMPRPSKCRWCTSCRIRGRCPRCRSASGACSGN